jgi:hypothetical protein
VERALGTYPGPRAPHSDRGRAGATCSRHRMRQSRRAASGATSRTVVKVGTARAVPPPHGASEDADGDPDSGLSPGGAHRRVCTTGCRSSRFARADQRRPAPSSTDGEKISTERLLQRLSLGLRAPVRATTTLANTERVVKRRGGDGYGPPLWQCRRTARSRRPRAGSASGVSI